MNLNKYDKQAFVTAVMDDVPCVDYDEQAKKLVHDWALTQMPKEVLAVYKKHPAWFKTEYTYMPGGLSDTFIPHQDGRRVVQNDAPELWAKLVELGVAAETQNDNMRDLRLRLEATIESCRTLKQAKERLPEFEKYLPTERGTTGCTNLPVANLVADLMQAGWPK